MEHLRANTGALQWMPLIIDNYEEIEIWSRDAMLDHEEHEYNFRRWEMQEAGYGPWAWPCAVCSEPAGEGGIQAFAILRQKNNPVHTILPLCKTCLENPHRIKMFVLKYYGVDKPIRYTFT